MRAIPAAALLALVLLQGCQPPTYRIRAGLEGERLTFTVRGSGSWPWRSEEGIEADLLRVRDAGRILWAIVRDSDRPGCTPSGPTPPFPLVYGEVPACYRELVPAAALAPSTLYRVEGEGLRHGSGWFRLGRGAAINLEWEQVEDEARSWPSLPDPAPLTSS